MSRSSALTFNSAQPLIVASISTQANLAIALKQPRSVDLFEIRADCWAPDPTPVFKAVKRLKRPLLLTVRSPLEGGEHFLSKAAREQLFETFLPYASLVDIEARSLRELARVVKKTREENLPLIVSYHDFKGMPSIGKMRELRKRAVDSGAAVFKIAMTPRKGGDLAPMAEFLSEKAPVALAVMGMGKWGRLSRLMCASLGSVLNYSYMDQAQVPGQWQSDRFRKVLEELHGSLISPK